MLTKNHVGVWDSQQLQVCSGKARRVTVLWDDRRFVMQDSRLPVQDRPKVTVTHVALITLLCQRAFVYQLHRAPPALLLSSLDRIWGGNCGTLVKRPPGNPGWGGLLDAFLGYLASKPTTSRDHVSVTSFQRPCTQELHNERLFSPIISNYYNILKLAPLHIRLVIFGPEWPHYSSRGGTIHRMG